MARLMLPHEERRERNLRHAKAEVRKTLARIEAQEEVCASEDERLQELYRELADDYAAVERYQ